MQAWRRGAGAIAGLVLAGLSPVAALADTSSHAPTTAYACHRSVDDFRLFANPKVSPGLYEWAGRTRDERVVLSDGTIATEPVLRKADGGKSFMDGPLIAEALDDIGRRLGDDNYLRGLDREEFATRAADIMLDLNSVHPFREGNGRTQRIFMSALAEDAGHKLDFSVVSRARMIQASIAGNENGDMSMMRRLFNEISDPVRVAALDKAIGALDQHGFAWNDHYIATAEPDHKIDVRLAGVAGEQFMARTQTAIFIGQTHDLPLHRPEQGQDFILVPTSWGQGRDIADEEYYRKIREQDLKKKHEQER